MLTEGLNGLLPDVYKRQVQHYETAHSDKKREEVSIGEYNELLTKEFFIIVENGIDTLQMCIRDSHTILPDPAFNMYSTRIFSFPIG